MAAQRDKIEYSRNHPRTSVRLTFVAAVEAEAPLSSSSLTTSRWPLYAACIKAVLPSYMSCMVWCGVVWCGVGGCIRVQGRSSNEVEKSRSDLILGYDEQTPASNYLHQFTHRTDISDMIRWVKQSRQLLSFHFQPLLSRNNVINIYSR